MKFLRHPETHIVLAAVGYVVFYVSGISDFGSSSHVGFFVSRSLLILAPLIFTISGLTVTARIRRTAPTSLSKTRATIYLAVLVAELVLTLYWLPGALLFLLGSLFGGLAL